MRTYTGTRPLLAASTALGALSIATAAQAQDRTAGASPDDQIIVVTAERREQALTDVPQSVTVVSEATLERQQATSFLDYAELIPGLSLTQTNPGESRVILRGINTGSVGSTIAIYVDDTPFGSSSSLGNAAILAGDFDPFDVTRIEVVRGPQGTLYGSNALGGVLRFITNPPRLGVFEARAQGGVENVDEGGFGWSGNALVNVPLGDGVAVRASGYYRRSPGYIDATGRTGEDINDADIYGGRVSVLFEPTETLSVRLTAIAQNIRADSASSFDVNVATLEPVGANGRRTRVEFFPDANNVDYRLYNGTLNWDFGFATLTSVTSFGRLEQAQLTDNTFGVTPLLPLIALLYGSAVPLGLTQDADIDQEKFTQEVRLASQSPDSLEWLIGGYYTRETVNLFQQFLPFELPTQQFRPRALLGRPEFLTAALDSIYKEYAGFANVTWHITPRWDVSAGGRYSHNEQNSVQITDGGFQVLQGLPAPLQISGQSSESVFTWSLSTRFEVSDQTSFYARVAKGYRPGGPNVVPPGAGPDFPAQFSADTLISYELGVRAQTVDRSFAIDASIYYLDWNDILIFGSFPSAIGPVGANDNGGGARSYGAEVSATLRPIRGLTVQLNGAYNNAKLTDDTPLVTGGLDGDELPYSPELTANASVDYQWELAGGATAFVGGDVRLVGEQAGDFSAAYRLTFGRQLEIPSYEVVDLRAGVAFRNFTVTAYARNIADSGGFVALGGFGARPGGLAGTVIRPRTIGLTVGADF